MPITINGSGTVTGISAGGLPDGIITSAELAAGAGGKVAQVVQSTITTEFIFNSSVYADATNFNALITPTNASSKVLVLMTPHVYVDNYTAGQTQISGKIVRGSTDIFEVLLLGNYGMNVYHPVPMIYLDSPATASAITYKLQVKASTSYNTSKINLSTTYAAKSTITLIEVLP